MILSTLVTNRTFIKIAFYYLLISIFTACFGAVYEAFSYGVYSYFMLYAFAFPLAGGCLPFFILGLWHHDKKMPPALCADLYHSGIATLTVGSVIRGVLDIYGTTNYLLNYYWIAGIILIFSSILGYFIVHRANEKSD